MICIDIFIFKRCVCRPVWAWSPHDIFVQVRKIGGIIAQPIRNFRVRRSCWLAPRPGLSTPVKDHTPIVHECERTSGTEGVGLEKV